MTIPSPDPLPLPAPPWLLWFLLILTFFLHILAMNFVLGGSIIAVSSPKLSEIFRKPMPTVMATAITLGVAPLLFLQALYGRLFFSSSVLMGWFWFSVVLLVMIAYYGAYAMAFRGPSRAIAAVVALILIGIAFIYTNNMTLMMRPSRFLPMYAASGRGFHLNLGDPTLIPRYLHMVLGAIAVAGMFAALRGHGARWFIIPTLLNIPVGLWWLAALPGDVLLRLMGHNPTATLILGLGIALGLGALLLMFVRRTMLAAAALILSLVCMVLTRDHVRRGMLDLTNFQMTTQIEPQWGVIALFAVLLVGALATTAWMVIALARARERAAQSAG
jgi:hypothetical protein